MNLIIIGGGWAGCAASIIGKKQGAEVSLVERTDMLLGLGNVGGIMRNNGRFTASEENIFLGAYELFNITDKLSIHKNIDFPGHKHAFLYDVSRIEKEIRDLLLSFNINIKLQSRAIDVIKEGDLIKAIVLSNGEIIYGDAFIDVYVKSIRNPKDIEYNISNLEEDLKREIIKANEYKELLREDKILKVNDNNNGGFELEKYLYKMCNYYSLWKEGKLFLGENININDEEVVKHLEQENHWSRGERIPSVFIKDSRRRYSNGKVR